YLNNETLAAEAAPGKDKKSKSKVRYSTPEEIYKQNKGLLCTNSNEITNAVKLMNEAARQLEHHATCKDGYQPCKWGSNLNNYNAITNILWDPALANKFNNSSVKRKIDRVYNPNLVIIQQRYKSWFGGPEKYFYALAAKFDISEKKTIIVMTSVNINDHNPSEDEYQNKIIENANLFKTDIDSENDIRKGKLKKTFVNIAGYLIEKKGPYVDVTYIESIDGHTSNYEDLINERYLNKFFSLK
ncbi:hypothetical protein YYE_03159, partial [Plasmodium vinckei vinckei]